MISTLQLAHDHALLKHSNEEKRRAHNEREKLREALQKKAVEEIRRLKTTEDFRAGFEDDEAPTIRQESNRLLLCGRCSPVGCSEMLERGTGRQR
jgi:urate oxidase